MIDRIEKVTTRAGTMDVFVAHPDGDGPFPVLVQLMDALGMREDLHQLGLRAAALGYYVLTPDLYYRKGVKGPIALDAAGIKIIEAAREDLTHENVTSDVEAALTFAERDKAARKGKIGVYGYCMGGYFALVLCQALGERVAVNAGLHPSRLVGDTPHSPHRHLDRVRAEHYFAIADKDHLATPEQMEELEKTLKARGADYQLEWYPGALHGFMMPGRETYNKEASEKVWSRMAALFARGLK